MTSSSSDGRLLIFRHAAPCYFFKIYLRLIRLEDGKIRFYPVTHVLYIFRTDFDQTILYSKYPEVPGTWYCVDEIRAFPKYYFESIFVPSPADGKKSNWVE